jgi:hypothetical protein
MNLRIRTLATVLVLSLLPTSFTTALTAQVATSTSAQSTPPTPPAPFPTQIAAAHTIFLTNGGADADFPLSEGESYDRVYAALKSWGRFQLVGSAADADLIFNLREIAPITDITGNRAGTYSITSPAFRLTITDPKTHSDLWTITSPVVIVGKKDVRDHWTSIAVTNLISRTKVLVNQPLSATETADLTTVPKTHGTRTVLIVVGATVAVAAVTAVLVHHAFEDSLANQKQQQDNFCIAHNIPLSECAGG